MAKNSKDPSRCWWCGDDELYMQYHDDEWGTPLHDEQQLFEFLCLEGAQAGLSWITILRKRAHYQKVYNQFNAHKIARYTDKKQQKLLADPGIIRNKLKVGGFVKNAKAYLNMLDQGLTFDQYFWDFVDGTPIQNNFTSSKQVPGNTPLSDQISKDLKKRGFTFVGSTICYAFMQATGMVNDHLVDCFRHKPLSKTKSSRR